MSAGNWQRVEPVTVREDTENREQSPPVRTESRPLTDDGIGLATKELNRILSVMHKLGADEISTHWISEADGNGYFLVQAQRQSASLLK